MIVIVDVNVIISALLKDSTTREIIVKSDFDFCFPEISLQKIRKYKSLILEKSGLSEREFQETLNIMLQNIKLISTEELMIHWKEAKKIMENIDEEDTPFISAALNNENTMIWSDDKHFDRQDKIITIKTSEMANLFYKDKFKSSFRLT